jgi:hypothetical protein
MIRWTAWLIVSSLAAVPARSAAVPDLPGESPFPGRFEAEVRPRYNHIEESDRPLVTEGGTLRAVAAWHSAPWHGLRLTLEGIHAAHFGPERFNDDPARFATSPYPLLPDPRHTGWNRAHVDYSPIEGVRIRAGRQRLRLDNQRWISDNDFRQVPQLFDGVTVAHDLPANARVTAGHYTRIRDTSGDAQDVKLTVLNAAWNPAPGHAVAAYGYFHDQPKTANFTGFADNSYRAIGVRAEGTAWRWGRFDVPYVAELAVQRPHGGGDRRIRAKYWRVGAGLATGAWTVRMDHETRGSNAGQYGMQMPLTDFYGFNGWTLHFFTVPPEGLRDRWATLRYAVGPLTLYVEGHRFRSDFGALDLGREADVGVTWEAGPGTHLRLQHARYDPGSGRDAPEIRKTWLTLTWTY